MIGIIILLSVFGLFFGGMGILILIFIVRKILEWWYLRYSAVMIEGGIRSLYYLPPSRNHGTEFQVTYSYDYQGKTYSKRESVSKEFYRMLDPHAPVSKGVPIATPLTEEVSASVHCASRRPKVARVVDPIGTEKSDVAGKVMHTVISAFGLFLLGLGAYSMFFAAQLLLDLLSTR